MWRPHVIFPNWLDQFQENSELGFSHTEMWDKFNFGVCQSNIVLCRKREWNLKVLIHIIVQKVIPNLRCSCHEIWYLKYFWCGRYLTTYACIMCSSISWICMFFKGEHLFFFFVRFQRIFVLVKCTEYHVLCSYFYRIVFAQIVNFKEHVFNGFDINKDLRSSFYCNGCKCSRNITFQVKMKDFEQIRNLCI